MKPTPHLEQIVTQEWGWQQGESWQVLGRNQGFDAVVGGPGECTETRLSLRMRSDGSLQVFYPLCGRIHVLVLPVEDAPAAIADRFRSLHAAKDQTPQSFRSTVERAFDPAALANDFMLEYERLLGKFAPDVSVIRFFGRIEEQQLQPPAVRYAFIQRFLGRALVVRFLQTKGWFRYLGNSDYINAMYANWNEEPGPYRFTQRMTLSFFSSLSQPSVAVRRILAERQGEVPYVGGGVFSPELYEREYVTPQGLVFVPDALMREILAPQGLFNAYPFTLTLPEEPIIPVSITPEILERIFRPSEHSEADSASSRELIARSRRELSLFVGADIADAEPHPHWLIHLRGLHVIDRACGTGSYLVSMFHEAMRLITRTEDLVGNRHTQPGVIASDLLRNNFFGFDHDELNVFCTRLRLILAAMTWNEDHVDPVPLPDLRDTIRHGLAFQETPDRMDSRRRLLTESANTEFKSGFELNRRLMMRDPEIRTGFNRTVAGFLNTDGGTLWIGVNDAGESIGIEDELGLIADGNKLDIYEQRIRENLKSHLDPIPLHYVSLEFVEDKEHTLCRVDVRPRPGVTYLVQKQSDGRTTEEVYVRDGNRTIRLTGRARDQFVLHRLESPQQRIW